ncbi:G-PROTEIN-RECEP-F1-2 domain-containing protein [Aphelenchoides bicaudatus]|nr:G-PROTEIN-RECEP-F1-2 domain-containing protein [Aphelenchoides bicaudatus]
MSFFKPVENVSIITNDVAALKDYVPNSFIYVILYIVALPPNLVLAYLGLKPGLINSRVRVPTTGMTLANLFGLFGFLLLNFIYLIAALNEVKLSLFFASFLRTILYNTTYVCYFLFPVLAIDQWLFVCRNKELTAKNIIVINCVCFCIPMAVAIYDLLLQNVVIYDFMFQFVRLSLYTNVVSFKMDVWCCRFIFFVLAPSFFIFSFVCNLLVLTSIVRRQSKSTRKQIGRALNQKQLQQQKGVVYTYTLQAFLPLLLATPYYIVNLCFMFGVEIDLQWFVISEAIIALHPLTNSVTTLFLLRPYRRAFKKVYPYTIICQDALRKRYNNIQEPLNSQKKEVETDSSGHSHSINANAAESSAVSL